ncbi:hypothetical protein OHA37_37535 [Streptomyces sp. NBC_00335]|uniref:hypothetical protein n=1 Tax=unclassified Streptomyces TaxID=2593676 RepID=UPI0022538FDC|nr:MULTISPECIES: hypothetical protein [unclassified Streptomyces]MCX5409548.1 hypothetical protein [Streptomyces sp. NBC_00086]
MASVAVLLFLATGCGNDTAPAWGYPELGATLGSMSRALDEGCAAAAPERCAEDLDRIDVLADRAFAQVLDHRLLDAAYVDARNEVARTREVRRAAAVSARSRREPQHLPLVRALAAERLAYRDLLATLERLRAAPPAGEGTQTV